MDTLTVYWYAIKYWAGGTPWEKAFETAVSIVNGWKED